MVTSYFACDWMICREDATGDKMMFALDLHLPRGLAGLASGEQTGQRKMRDGSVIQRWRTTRPISDYLFAFAIGRFQDATEVVQGNHLRYVSDVADSATLRRLFALTPQIERFLEDRAGVPLPDRAYTQLLVGGDEAQEQAGYAIIGRDNLPDPPENPTEDWAIVHELAHQWWGSLITCDSLRNLWLNEGLAVFMTAAWKEHHYGRAAYEAEIALAQHRLIRARAAGYDKPLSWDGTYPSLSLRRDIQYGKSVVFIDALRRLMGDDAFWRGLRSYTREHAGGVVDGNDFETDMQSVTTFDLGKIFATWVFDPAD